MSGVPQYAQQGPKLAAMQFQNSPNFLAVLEVLAGPIQELEEVGQRLLYLRTLELTDGVGLDEIGNELDEDRGLRGDAEFRNALRTVILRNTCGGTPDDIIRYVKSLTGASDVQYSEQYPRKFTVSHNGTVVLRLPRLLRDIAIVGTGDITVTQGTITQVDRA